MLRIPYSEVLDPDRPFVAWSLGMRSNQFSNCTQRGTEGNPTEGNTSYAVKGRNPQCGKAITDGGICSWCDLLGKPECGVTGKSSLSLTKTPDISFHKRREVHCSMIQLHPRCGLRGGVVRCGEPWHRESRDGAASTGSTTTWLCDLEWVTSPRWAFCFFIHRIRLEPYVTNEQAAWRCWLAALFYLAHTVFFKCLYFRFYSAPTFPSDLLPSVPHSCLSLSWPLEAFEVAIPRWDCLSLMLLPTLITRESRSYEITKRQQSGRRITELWSFGVLFQTLPSVRWWYNLLGLFL